MDKLGIHEIAGLTRYAIANGYISVSGTAVVRGTQEELFDRVRLAYAGYRWALDAYAAFLKERESIGFSNPDGTTCRQAAIIRRTPSSSIVTY